MVRLTLAAFAVAILAVASVAATAPTLDSAFTQLRQSIKPAAAALKKSVATHHIFRLEFERGRWRLFNDPNPTWPDLTLNVNEGDHVTLELSYWRPSRRDDRWGPGFDIDGLDAVVDGQASEGIHIWLHHIGERAFVEFDAVKPGAYFIYSRQDMGQTRGRLMIWEKKK